MKKSLILTAVSILISISAMAQGHKGNHPSVQPRNGNAPRVQMQHNIDAVVDTAVINHIDLSKSTLEEVTKLQEKKKNEMMKMTKDMKKEIQQLSEEQRAEMRKKQEDFKAQYRKDLRKVLGDEKYILYLEKQLDRRSVVRQGGNNHRQGQGNSPRTFKPERKK
ncbi:MAG: hypothetical protein KBT20_02175 [Bacteroidales bacterium]|nr:hypothetical protein [Candidatus Liminaster caballi]